jgi:hypothetical protein
MISKKGMCPIEDHQIKKIREHTFLKLFFQFFLYFYIRHNTKKFKNFSPYILKIGIPAISSRDQPEHRKQRC